MDLQQLPKDDLLRTAFDIYRASDLTKGLQSERNRKIFAEDFETYQPTPLETICLKVIAQNYKGRPINLNLKPMQLRTLYDYINPDLPLNKCININDEYYWKRVYAFKCNDKMLLMQKNVCWKKLAITLKYAELIENTPYEVWVADDMRLTTKMVSPYVIDLKISKLQPMREETFHKESIWSVTSFESEASEEEGVLELEPVLEVEESEDSDEPVEPAKYDYPVEDCHHVDLGVVKYLLNLNSLTLEFLPPELGTNYHGRYFNFSYMDIQQLASGISKLTNLKILQIRHSRMDSVKLSTMLEALKSMSVEHLVFYFCQLDDECGESLYEYLISTESLKHLNFSGNHFRDTAIDDLTCGIQSSPSEITYLGLSNNPISDESFINLTQSLLTCESLQVLTLSGVNLTKEGAESLACLIKDHPNLVELEIIAVPMDAYSLIDAMQTNKKIQKLFCQGCGLTLEEEFKVELLLRRNRYIKENPYIGDPTKTEEEINEFVSRTKNPMLLRCLAELKRRATCLEKLRDRSTSFADLGEGEKMMQKEAKKLTEEDLNDRVTLYGQTEINFFKKQNPK